MDRASSRSRVLHHKMKVVLQLRHLRASATTQPLCHLSSRPSRISPALLRLPQTTVYTRIVRSTSLPERSIAKQPLSRRRSANSSLGEATTSARPCTLPSPLQHPHQPATLLSRCPPLLAHPAEANGKPIFLADSRAHMRGNGRGGVKADLSGKTKGMSKKQSGWRGIVVADLYFRVGKGPRLDRKSAGLVWVNCGRASLV